MTVPPFTLPGYTLRPPTRADIPDILDLLYAHDQAVMEEEPDRYTQEDILSDWENLNLSSDACVLLTGDGMLAAYATVTLKPKTGRIVADAYVHPSHVGQGLGTFLLAFTEARAHILLAAFPEDCCVLLVNNIVVSSDSARHLLESSGYALRRVFFIESIVLDGSTPQPVWPDGLSVRTCDGSPEDLYRVYEAVEDGFRDHWAHEPRSFEAWQLRMMRELFDPSLWFLVQMGDEIVATALGRILEEGRGWIDQLAVRRAWRKQGLGASLLYQAFGTFSQRGVSHVGLGVDSQSLTGAQRLYKRVGMHVVLRIGHYEKELRSGRELSPEA